ncbi:MAG: hypothetical protein AAF587_20995 [Bacteroidota bacterium]
MTNRLAQIGILISLMITFGCRNGVGPETVVTGRVFDPVLATGWVGVKVILLDFDDLDILEEAFADAQGNYEIRYQSRRTDPVMVGINLDDIASLAGISVTTCDAEVLQPVSLGENQQIDFTVLPTAQLNLSLINDNCQGPSDRLALSWKSGQAECKEFSYEFDLEGCDGFNPAKDSLLFVPAGKQIFEWEVRKDGITESFSDSLVINPGEEFEFDILY